LAFSVLFSSAISKEGNGDMGMDDEKLTYFQIGTSCIAFTLLEGVSVE